MLINISIAIAANSPAVFFTSYTNTITLPNRQGIIRSLFWFVVYWFETGRNILLEDGAFMAELVSSCSKFDNVNMVRWIYRKDHAG